MKSDGLSPTVVTESIFMTGVVDAKERRNVTVLDIANTFLQADNDETVNMLLSGEACWNDGKDRPSIVPGIRDLLCERGSHVVREAV